MNSQILIQLGNKNDLEGHAPVTELIKALSVSLFFSLCGPELSGILNVTQATGQDTESASFGEYSPTGLCSHMVDCSV